MAKEKVDKHYRISKDIIDQIIALSNGKFPREVASIEYFLKKGIDSVVKEKSDDLLYKEVKRNSKDIYYIKNLLEQMFSNKKFACNRKINEDEALKEFRSNLYKDKFYE